MINEREMKPMDQLWESFKEGDRNAFASIYRQHASLLLSYGMKIAKDSQLVEDSIQDLFIELWSSRERVSSTTSVKFYLFKALRYKIYRKINGTVADKTDSLETHLDVLRDYSDEENYQELDPNSAQMIFLKESLEKLPVRQREAINLRYFNHFTNEEIALIMEVNYHSACKLIYAGLKNLKNSLKATTL